MSLFRTHYSALDRTLHRLAFRGIGLQKMVAEFEDDVYARPLRDLEIVRPVFITSLPRAGTTLLLNLVSGLPGFATHSYRNMPLLLCPLFWDALTRRFRQRERLQERAHGDGMAVGFDSPEAFEEVVWKAFWPGKYREDAIETWTASDRDAEFEDFFRRHIRKILFLKLGRERADGCYVSKNNANLARLDLLPQVFPDCRIVVPFRKPRDHVGSLLRQHRNFLKMHAEDGFAADYMESIGHHDFGRNLKPIDFDGWLAGAEGDPLGHAFWLGYWTAGFRFLMERRSHHTVLIDYDALCREPDRGVALLLEAVGAPEVPASGLSHRFRAPTHYANDDLQVDRRLLAEAEELHAALAASALNGAEAAAR